MSATCCTACCRTAFWSWRLPGVANCSSERSGCQRPPRHTSIPAILSLPTVKHCKLPLQWLAHRFPPPAATAATMTPHVELMRPILLSATTTKEEKAQACAALDAIQPLLPQLSPRPAMPLTTTGRHCVHLVHKLHRKALMIGVQY